MKLFMFRPFHWLSCLCPRPTGACRLGGPEAPIALFTDFHNSFSFVQYKSLSSPSSRFDSFRHCYVKLESESHLSFERRLDNLQNISFSLASVCSKYYSLQLKENKFRGN
jgi:hypothetical protein